MDSILVQFPEMNGRRSPGGMENATKRLETEARTFPRRGDQLLDARARPQMRGGRRPSGVPRSHRRRRALAAHVQDHDL